ncbi:MAG TPA: TadE/TadG family type IV pilus assembly protein [Candidatus Acidoferrales bacterium]|nr:TadE/TadG family type IV pilus assembly protein [Candidatus Acidoferrales bacterium]
MKKAKMPPGRPQRGGDVLEAALVLPVLLTVLLAVYSFGRGWNAYQTMTQASREGLREAVTTFCDTCSDPTIAASHIRQQFVYPALEKAKLDTSKVRNYTQGYAWLDGPNSQEVCGVYVSFSYPYTLTIPFTPVPLTTITLTTKTRMRLANHPRDGTCP